jgi:NAD(P)-dependent dehydrogenase (short-subunit alcohol dehydrogenase family)
MTLTEDGSRQPGGALVTGGARGLGLEIARRLAARGHAVHVTDKARAGKL